MITNINKALIKTHTEITERIQRIQELERLSVLIETEQLNKDSIEEYLKNNGLKVNVCYISHKGRS